MAQPNVGEYCRRVAGSTGNRYTAQSRTLRTWRQYASACSLYSEWRESQGMHNGRAAFATVTDGELLAYVVHLADSGYTYATIAAYIQAIATRHRLHGHEINRRALAETLRGIRRAADAPAQARPLLGVELAAILSGLDANAPADVRDGALLAVGWGAALRRIELTGLDWQRRGPQGKRGTGTLRITPRGVEIELVRSKTSQEARTRIEIAAADMPDACEWLTRWAAVSRLRPGEPVFRRVYRCGRIGHARLCDGAVARMLRARVFATEIANGVDPEDARRHADATSGHSMRAGYATTAAINGVPEYLIRAHMRHKSASMTARYIRAAETEERSGLAGVWLGVRAQPDCATAQIGP